MEPVRPSILNMRSRNAGAVSKTTQESAEEQYRREQELIAAKGRRLQQSEQRLINTLYPTAEHVRARQHEILTMQEQALAAQVEAKQREATSAALLSRAVHKDAMDQSHIRPWTAATISYQSDEEERQARRHFSHQLAADNLKLMAERALQRQQQVVQETQQERSAIASEREFWNLGASNARWIAPEHRHLAPSPPRSARATPTTTASAPTTPVATTVTPPWATSEDSLHVSRSSISRSNSSNAAAALQQQARPYPVGTEHYRMQKKHVQSPNQRDGKAPWEYSGLHPASGFKLEGGPLAMMFCWGASSTPVRESE